MNRLNFLKTWLTGLGIFSAGCAVNVELMSGNDFTVTPVKKYKKVFNLVDTDRLVFKDPTGAEDAVMHWEFEGSFIHWNLPHPIPMVTPHTVKRLHGEVSFLFPGNVTGRLTVSFMV